VQRTLRPASPSCRGHGRAQRWLLFNLPQSLQTATKVGRGHDVIQVQLGRRRPSEPTADNLYRSAVGATPDMSADEAWEAGRGVWKLRADRALQEDQVKVVDTAGTVLTVATLTGISKAGARFALEGTVLRDDARIGRPTDTPHPSRNPIAYVSG